MRYIFDVETDGFLDTYSTIHCLVLLDIDTQAIHSFGPFQIEAGLSLLQEADLIVGHNIIKFDLPVIEKLYPDFQFQGTVRDTLLMSRLVSIAVRGRLRHECLVLATELIARFVVRSIAWLI